MINHAKLIKSTDLPTDYSKIYDHVYGKFAKQKKYNVSYKYKTKLISIIFRSLPEEEQHAVNCMVKSGGDATRAYKKYINRRYLIATNTSIKEISRLYEQAIRHMYSPKNIAIAVNNYYKIPRKGRHKLTLNDFGGNKRTLTALNNNDIYFREQLLKHLSNGWYYLWTISGCGDIARQRILMAIDKWNKEAEE